MGFQVRIDRDECISAGRCVLAAPSFFEFDDDEIASVDPDAEHPDDATLLKIARQCPSGAIKLSQDGAAVDL